MKVSVGDKRRNKWARASLRLEGPGSGILPYYRVSAVLTGPEQLLPRFITGDYGILTAGFSPRGIAD